MVAPAALGQRHFPPHHQLRRAWRAVLSRLCQRRPQPQHLWRTPKTTCTAMAQALFGQHVDAYRGDCAPSLRGRNGNQRGLYTRTAIQNQSRNSALRHDKHQRLGISLRGAADTSHTKTPHRRTACTNRPSTLLWLRKGDVQAACIRKAGDKGRHLRGSSQRHLHRHYTPIHLRRL